MGDFIAAVVGQDGQVTISAGPLRKATTVRPDEQGLVKSVPLLSASGTIDLGGIDQRFAGLEALCRVWVSVPPDVSRRLGIKIEPPDPTKPSRVKGRGMTLAELQAFDQSQKRTERTW